MSHRQAPLSERVSYQIDNLMASNPAAKLLALGIATAVVIVAGAAAVILVSGEGVGAAFWTSWTYVADPGTHAEVNGIPERAVAVALTMGGMLFFALLIGLVADGISERVDELKRGRSRVLEEDHTLLLGWSDKLLPLVEQIAIANESEGGGVIAILAERDKEEMETEVREWGRDLRGSRVVCRSGSPLLTAHLRKVSAESARAVVVLSSDNDPDESDARSIRTLLALRRGIGELRGHVVVELSDADNEELVGLVGDGAARSLVAHDMIGRLMIQCARQPGLAQVYSMLLGFQGDEFYLQSWPELTGVPFGALAERLPAAIPCGIRGADGVVVLNPPRDRALAAGDELLVIAEDNDSYAPAPPAAVDVGAAPAWTPPLRAPEQVLFCGWRRDLRDMIRELDAYVAPGSALTILSTVPTPERVERLEESGLGPLENLSLIHEVGNPVLRRHLEALPMERYDAALILASEGGEDGRTADSRSLVTLLLVRDIQSRRGREGATLISEICDPRTKGLVSVAEVSDYVVSNELVSMALAQIAERQEIAGVLAELFSADRNEIYLRDARRYASEGESLSFWQVAGRALALGEIAVGYRPEAGAPILNPRDKTLRRAWAPGDQLVVIAED